MNEEARAYLATRGITDAKLISRIAANTIGDRVWFYFIDAQGKRVYKTGRAMRNGMEPPWLNEPISGEPADKPGLFASPGAWTAGRVGLVEGVIDALACEQGGLAAFAACGNRLTDEAVSILARKADVVVIPDRDAGGDVLLQEARTKLSGKTNVAHVAIPDAYADLAEVAELASSPGGDPAAQVGAILSTTESVSDETADDSAYCSAEDLLNIELAPPRFCIPNLAVRGEITTLYAQVGAGKTTLYQAAIVAAAHGKPFLEEDFEGTQTFVIFDWENSRAQVARDLKRLGLTTPTECFHYYFSSSASLDTEDGRKRVRDLLMKHDATCAIFDSRDAGFSHTSELEGDLVGPAMRSAKDLALDLDIAMLLVSHEPKADYKDSAQKLRGHTAWAQLSDQMFRLERKGDVRILEHTKHRGIDRRPQILIRRATEGDQDVGPIQLEAEVYQGDIDTERRRQADVATVEKCLDASGDLPWKDLKDVVGLGDTRLRKAIAASQRVWQPKGRSTPYSTMARPSAGRPA